MRWGGGEDGDERKRRLKNGHESFRKKKQLFILLSFYWEKEVLRAPCLAVLG